MGRIECMGKALLFMEENLKRKISTEDIADAANYSLWYFHRSFTLLTGYQLFDYLRRRRLSEVCYELLYTPKPLKQLALEYQFESQEAFTRSFKSFSGYTPGKFRREKAIPVRFQAINADKSYHYLKKGETKMKPRYENKEAFMVTGVFIKAKPSETMHKLWEEFMRRIKEIPHVKDDKTCYQVCVYDAKSAADENYLFIAGMEVAEAGQVPEGMMCHQVQAAEYAVFEHKGALDKLHSTYEYIFGVWMNENDKEAAEGDCLEVYDERFKYGEPDSVLEIWIPVKK